MSSKGTPGKPADSSADYASKLSNKKLYELCHTLVTAKIDAWSDDEENTTGDNSIGTIIKHLSGPKVAELGQRVQQALLAVKNEIQRRFMSSPEHRDFYLLEVQK